MQLHTLEPSKSSIAIATINNHHNKRLRSNSECRRLADDVSNVKEAIQFLETLSQSAVSQELILTTGLSGALPDLPPIYWYDLLGNSGEKDDRYITCYAKADNVTSTLVDDVFASHQRRQTTEKVYWDILQGAQAVYLSATVLDNHHHYQHVLFFLDRAGEEYRITEFATNRKMSNHFRFAVQKVYYAKNMTLLMQAVDTILTESISLCDFIAGEKPSGAIDAVCLDFLEESSFCQNTVLSRQVSGLAVTGLAKRLFPLSLLHNVITEPEPNDLLSSEAYRQDNQLMHLLTRVRLHVSSAPDVRCNQGKVTLLPREVSSRIHPEAMAKYPIVQGLDPRMPNETFSQPYAVTEITHCSHVAVIASEDLDSIMSNIDEMLQNQTLRERNECEYYDYTTITSDNLPSGLEHDVGTLGIQGVVAKKDIPQYTPVIYKQQYAEQGSPEQCAMIVAMRNHAEYGLNMYRKVKQGQARYLRSTKDSFVEAHRLRSSYSWNIAPCDIYRASDGLKNRELWTNAWGAGSVANGINGDFSDEKHFANHASITCRTVDKQGNLAPPVVVYLSLSDIKQGQELLVDYGQSYILSDAARGNIMRVSHDLA